MIDKIAEMYSITRLHNEKKSKNFPNPEYGIITGIFLGYAESDDHYRKRILKIMREKGNESAKL